jgi:hypothetical protein
MKARKLFVYVLAILFFLILTSCEDKKKDNDFSGVSRLIADRNKARYENTEKSIPNQKPTSKKEIIKKNSTVKSESSSKEKELSSIVLYEENVKILGSKSGKTLAKGVAYINKQGQIVKLKIIKN